MISQREVLTMLEHCLPGFTHEVRLHRRWIHFGGRTFRGLPLGEHGRRVNEEIQTGHVRKITRFFGIEDCARGELPQV